MDRNLARKAVVFVRTLLVVALSVMASFAQAQYYDAETGLHYNGARYYDPKAGRYISADPVSVGEHVQRNHMRMRDPSRFSVNEPPLELNPYPYVANNPLRWIDPDGTDTLCPGGTSIVDPATNIVTCVGQNRPEPPQCVSGDCANVFPPATNSQCMIKCMIEDAPFIVKAACKAVKDPLGDIIAKTGCKEYFKGQYCITKCNKEVTDSCPDKK